MKISIALVALAAVVGVTAVSAQGDPITARKNLMKANSAQGRDAREMMDGKKPFDLAAAKKILAGFQDTAAKLPALFPAESKAGDTRVLPAIWDKPAEFKAAVDKFAADAKAAEASTKDLDSFKAAMGAVGKNCGSCHDAFRKPQS